MQALVGDAVEVEVGDAEQVEELFAQLTEGCGVASVAATVAVSPVVDDGGNPVKGDGHLGCSRHCRRSSRGEFSVEEVDREEGGARIYILPTRTIEMLRC